GDSERAGDPEPALPSDVPGDRRYVTVDGRRFHLIEAGPADGNLVVCLHGFPEFWYGWRDQIGPLARAGYRVVVPDQRGYNRSAKPDAVSAYRIERLADDVIGLIEAYDHESAAVVGHDWGGVVGWWLAIHQPERVARLVTCNGPHPTVIRRRLRTDPGQLLRSYYAVAFQLPAVPEAVSRAFDWRLPVRQMRRTSLPGTFDAAEFDRYRAAWRRSFSSMLDWYRAAARYRPRPETNEVRVPTRVIWGASDATLPHAMAFDSLDFCVDGRSTTLEDATHWLQHEYPARVADAILDELD
ncbi:MAG: alpha/beta fold hydrolase, partial [Halobaculum sp.]